MGSRQSLINHRTTSDNNAVVTTAAPRAMATVMKSGPRAVPGCLGSNATKANTLEREKRINTAQNQAGASSTILPSTHSNNEVQKNSFMLTS